MQNTVILNFSSLLGRPDTCGCLDRYGQVGCHRAGIKTELVDGEGIDKGLNRRANLTLALLGHIVLEVAEIRAANIRLYVARARIHCNQRRTHNALVVEYRVARRHQRVALTLEGEDAHLALLVERGEYLLLAHTQLLVLAVSVRVLHCTLDDCLNLLLLQVLEQDTRVTHLRIHTWLDNGLHLLLHGLLGVALHSGVDGGVDTQTITVDIIGRAIGLSVLVTPAVKRILIVLLHGLLVVPVGEELAACRTLRIHHVTQHLTEVCSLTLVVRDRLILQCDGQGRERVAHAARKCSSNTHTAQNQVSAR